MLRMNEMSERRIILHPFDRQLMFPGFQPPFADPGSFDPPPFAPPSGMSPSGPPSGPPPSYTPTESPGVGVYAVDPGGLRGCLYRFTYIRLTNRTRFWFYPVFVGRTSVAGWRWRPRQRRWVYFGIDLTNISSYTCV